MQKLTLSIDERVIVKAKRYAAAQGTSISKLVETYLDLVPGVLVAAERRTPPVLGRLRGALKDGSVRDYHRYLERKYR
jgi:hypothetical protein